MNAATSSTRKTSKRQQATEKCTCALCGKAHEYTGYWRWVYKRNDRLESGYYTPRLSEEEMYLLPWGEQIVCTDRKGCNRRRFAQKN
jgi:hypothetical protein